MEGSVTDFKTIFTWKLLKVILMLTLLEIMSFAGTVYGYISVINLYELSDDPATFVKISALLLILLNLPTSFLMQFFMRISPKKLMSGMYLVKGLSLLLYGVTIYQVQMSPTTRLIICMFVTLPMLLVAHLNSTYFSRHLMVEFSELFDIKLGVLNSLFAVLGMSIGALKLIIVGQIYDLLPLEDSTMYLCSFCFLLTMVMAGYSLWLFRDFKPLPISKSESKRGIVGDIKKQIEVFNNCKIKKVMLAKAAEVATINPIYVELFFLSAGLTPLWVSYLGAVRMSSGIVACVLNILKYRYNWLKHVPGMLVGVQAVALFFGFYIFIAWLAVVWVPWLRGIEVAETDQMPTWMVVFYVLMVGSSLFTCTMGLIREEFLQKMISKEDRGAVAGVSKFFALSLDITRSAVYVFLPTAYLYMVSFVLDIVVHVVMLAIVVSYTIDVANENHDYEKLPLNPEEEEGEEEELYRKRERGDKNGILQESEGVWQE